MSSIRTTLTQATHHLAPISETPRLDAELLLAHALGITREALLLSDPAGPAPLAFEALLARRLAHVPVAYITGRRAFWTIDLAVGPGVLIPRGDSETLIEAALDHFAAAGPDRILDLGAGPGTLLLAALDQWPNASGIGVDRSAEAIVFARANADRLGIADRAAFRQGDWDAGLAERFDLILCNPPYVEDTAPLAPQVRDWEPAEALFAGADGLDAYRALAPRIGRLLAPRGIVCIEIGVGQAAAVSALFAAEGFTVSSRPDLNPIVRCLILRV